MSESKQAKYVRPEEINASVSSNVLASINMNVDMAELAISQLFPQSRYR